MGLGLGACMVLAGPLVLGLTGPGTPSFADAWYREVVLGDLAAAGDLYQRIYQDIEAASRSSAPIDFRRKAALRAGGCFERSGDVARAREAYSWLLRSTPADDPTARAARLRLAGLPAAVPAPTPGAPLAPGLAPPPGSIPAIPPPPAPSPGLSPSERLRLRIERREWVIAALRTEAGRVAELVRAEDRVRTRLEEMGIEVHLDPTVAAKAPPGVEDLIRDLDPEDRDALHRRLAERAYLKGLRSLRDRDPGSAAVEFRKALRYGGEGRGDAPPEYRDAAELLRTCEGLLRPMEGFSRFAALRLQEADAWDGATVLGSLRAAVTGRSGDPTSPAPPADLDRARAEEDWAPVRLERNLELRALAREAGDRLAIDGLPSDPGAIIPAAPFRPDELRARARHTALELTEIADDLVDSSWKSVERRRPATAPDPIHRVPPAVAEELERLLVRGEERYRALPGDVGPDGWRREFQEIRVLIQWFPAADADGRYGKIALDYLGRGGGVDPRR